MSELPPQGPQFQWVEPRPEDAAPPQDDDFDETEDGET